MLLFLNTTTTTNQQNRISHFLVAGVVAAFAVRYGLAAAVVASVRAYRGRRRYDRSPASRTQAGERSSYSPLLFSLLINELVTVVREKGTDGVQFVQGMAQVFLLLFADDVALESLTPGGSE